MNWIYLAILAAFFYGTYNFFIKVSSGHINQVVGAVILQIVAALIGGLALLLLKITGHALTLSKEGVMYAVSAGICVGAAEIASFFLFSRGVTVSTGTAIVIGASIVFAAILGAVFLKEQLTLQHLLAIIFVVAGVILLIK